MNKLPYLKIFLLALFIIVIISPVRNAFAVSLLQDGGLKTTTITGSPRGFYETYQARNVGDVITVRIIENVNVLKRNEVKLKRDTDLNAKFAFTQGMTATSTATPADNDIASMITSFTFPGQYKRGLDRSINVNSDDTFTTMVSALVVEVDAQSNNMVVEGSRQIVIEGQTKSL